jgi:hypothetical protein
MAGREPRTQAELFAQIAAAQDRQDRRDQVSEERWREQYGQRRPGQTTVLLAAAKAERQAREQVAAAEPVTVGELVSLKEKITNVVHHITGRKPSL